MRSHTYVVLREDVCSQRTTWHQPPAEGRMTKKQVDVETGEGLGRARARAPGSGDRPDSVKSTRPCGEVRKKRQVQSRQSAAIILTGRYLSVQMKPSCCDLALTVRTGPDVAAFAGGVNS